MCGRFTLRTPLNRLIEQFMVMPIDDLRMVPRYNIAPTQPIAVVRADPERPDQRQLTMARWGLIPSWAKDVSVGNRMINARAETVATKPAFRHVFRHRRCLVIADGYYEWRRGKTSKSVKQPYYFQPVDGQTMAFAGLWETWRAPDGQVIESATIITTAANDFTRPFHDRMPAILGADHHESWLATTVDDTTRLRNILRPCRPDLLSAVPVSRTVNNPRNDQPQCIEPIDRPEC